MVPASLPRARVLPQLGLALLSLLLASFAFHPVDLPFLAWLALVPWMAYHRSHAPRGTGRCLMAGYYLHFVCMLWWIGEVAPPVVWLVPLLGMPFVFVMARLLDLAVHRARLPASFCYPAAIVGQEVLREALLGVTWCPLGYAVWRQESLVQTAAWFGVHGASFAVLSVNAGLAGLLCAALRVRSGIALRARALLPDLLAGGLPLAAALLLGGWLAGGVSLEEGPLAVGIQPNIEQGVKLRATRASIWERCCRTWTEGRGADLDPDLLVIPETTFFPVQLPRWPLRRLLAMGDGRLPGGRVGGILPGGRGQLTVLGYGRFRSRGDGSSGPDNDGDGFDEWNVAGVLRDGTELLGEYAKRKLVPFGEMVPAPGWLPGRERLIAAIHERAGYVPDLTAGTAPLVVPPAEERSPWRFGLTICYEMVFPEYFRELPDLGAGFVVNISNDGWYRESSELDLVHVAARFRAIEIRRSLFRVSNTGISTLVDPLGRYVATVEDGGRRKSVSGLLVGRIPLCRQLTPYARYGLLPAAAFGILFLGLLAWRLLSARLSRAAGD